jgi:hypothetical protein
MSLDESEGNFMATSSITANFYCDDAKAANAFVRMLSQPIKSATRKSKVVFVSDATIGDEDSFVKRFKDRWLSSRRASK